MADAAELKDLAWENQWTVVGRRIELLSYPWLPGSSDLNQPDYSNHMGLDGRATPDQGGGCWVPGFHREGLRATKQGRLGLLELCSHAVTQSSYASVGNPCDGPFCKPALSQPCARPAMIHSYSQPCLILRLLTLGL